MESAVGKIISQEEFQKMREWKSQMTNLYRFPSAMILERDHAPSVGCWEGICT